MTKRPDPTWDARRKAYVDRVLAEPWPLSDEQLHTIADALRPFMRATPPVADRPAGTPEGVAVPASRDDVGRRVSLVRTTDKHTKIEPGTLGTVKFVDALGTLHVEWDDGSRLGLVCASGDRWTFVD